MLGILKGFPRSFRCTLLYHIDLHSKSNHHKIISIPYLNKRLSSSSQYVLNSVKKSDYESYLCLLLLPKRWRYPAFVINAYNIELSLILETSKEPRATAGRFAFWSDALERIFRGDTPFDHPVIIELNKVYQHIASAQTRTWLTQLLNARQSINQVSHIETLQKLEDYSEKTRSSVLYLTSAVAGVSSVDADHAASHLGRCLGLVTTLRSTPYLTSKSQLLIPQDILIKHKLSQQDILKAHDRSKEAFYDVASAAYSHLETTKNLLAKVPKEVISTFLPIVICEHRLELLRLCDFNVFDRKFQKKNGLLPWQLWRANRKL